MSAPTWLIKALEDCARDGLTTGTAFDRDRIADAIADAFPRGALVDGLSESITAVLKQRAIRDEGKDLAREIARNASQVAQFVLELAPETGE